VYCQRTVVYKVLVYKGHFMHIKRGQLPRKTGIVRKENLEKIKPIEQRINEKKYFYIRTIKQLLEYPYR